MTVSEPIRHVERAVAEPPVAGRRPRRTPRLGDTLMGMALLLGPANVIMQLAQPGVGYGVMESRVESGRIDLHPIKRARTTFT
ncbi:MAG TPA: oxygenase MpaB family protein, partial [Mycobacterium sp.]|nr:oxygenase MpaB family protein [Mycobacterium sp.]